MKKKGFTLIELLAVIIILAIIALIAVPIVMNLIEQSKKSAFEDTAYGIIKAGELYYSKNMLMNSSEAVTEKSFDFSDKESIKVLNIKGSLPESGTMNIDKDGNVTIALSNGKYCAKLVDDKVVLDTDLENCTLTPIVQLILNPSNECVHSSTPCTLAEIKAGISMQIRVNDTDTSTFYVIADDGSKLTLIMDQNLPNSKVAWISQEDYEAANTDGTSCLSSACNDEGPITSLNLLEERTSGWTNINFDYILSDDGGGDKYTSMNKSGVHSRIITKTEAINLGCKVGTHNSCPAWLYANLSADSTDEEPFGYCTSAAGSGSGFNAIYVNGSGCVNGARIAYTAVSFGIRPVIEIPKIITE